MLVQDERRETHLELRTVELVRTPRELLKVDLRADLHLPRVDPGGAASQLVLSTTSRSEGNALHDLGSRLFVRQGELDLAVETAGTQQCRVENIDSVRRRNDLRGQALCQRDDS